MAVFGKTALINKLVFAVRKGLTPQNIRDLVDSLWRDPKESLTIIKQPTHGFAVGDAIRHNGTRYVKARAINTSNANTVGVVSAVYNVNNFSYKNEGTIESDDFTAGESYYLSPITPGLITTISESFNWQNGMVKQLIGQGVPDGLELEIDAGHVVGELNDDITDIVTEQIEQINTDTINTLITSYFSGFKYSDIIITSLASYTYTTVWEVKDLNQRMGEFKVTVFLHDLDDDTTSHMQSVLGFDYINAAAEVSQQDDVIIGSPYSLTLGINGSGFLTVTVAMPVADTTRIHFCFERCVLADDKLPEAEALLELEGDAELTSWINMEGDAELELTGEAELSDYNELDAVADFEMDGDAELSVDTNLESDGDFELDGEAILDDVNGYPEAEYGSLYNFPAIEELGNLAPTGFRVARLEDVVDLIEYMGGDTVAGGKLKDTDVWTSPNTGATDEAGFSATPAGYRSDLGAFVNKLLKNRIWFDNR